MERKGGAPRRTLSYEQQYNIRRRFPKDIELPVENYLPGKVQADVYEVLPVGKPAMLWFTFFEDGHAAFVVTKTQRGNRYDIVRTCFESELAYGTVLSGIFTIRSKEDGTPHSFFCANDVLYYKGNSLRDSTLFGRLSTLYRIFNNNEVGNLGPTDDVLTIKTSVMTSDFTLAQGHLNTLPYPAYGIRMFNLRDKQSVGILTANNNKSVSSDIRCVFLVKANADPDSYTLFGKDPNGGNAQCNAESEKLVSVGLALVPSYSDSVRMNLLFRNIRENVSLDYIEESEDEDEFQDINPTKYLLDGAKHKMNCYFSKACNRWVPESVASDDSHISIAQSAKPSFSRSNGHSNTRGHAKNQLSDRSNRHNGVASPTRRPLYKPVPSNVVHSSAQASYNRVRKPIFTVFRR